MEFDRADFDGQFFGDHLIGVSGDHQIIDLPLPFGQRAEKALIFQRQLVGIEILPAPVHRLIHFGPELVQGKRLLQKVQRAVPYSVHRIRDATFTTDKDDR